MIRKVDVDYEMSFVKQTLSAVNEYWIPLLLGNEEAMNVRETHSDLFHALMSNAGNLSKRQLKILLDCKFIEEELIVSRSWSQWASYIVHSVSWNPHEMETLGIQKYLHLPKRNYSFDQEVFVKRPKTCT